MGLAMSDDNAELEDESNQDEDQDEDSGSDNSAPPDNKSASGGDDKRVNDLMSKWQAEQAKSANLQKEIDALKGKSKPAPKDKPAGDPVDNSQADEFVQFARESARKQLFDSEPRFAEYGLDVDAISGQTLSEMKAAAKAQLSLIDGIESRARNRILAEHGLDPDITTGQGEKPTSFSTMSDKEFAEFMSQRDARR